MFLLYRILMICWNPRAALRTMTMGKLRGESASPRWEINVFLNLYLVVNRNFSIIKISKGKFS
jgi:hypothetical protein